MSYVGKSLYVLLIIIWFLYIYVWMNFDEFLLYEELYIIKYINLVEIL